MKKIISLLLAMVMVCSLATVAFAEDSGTPSALSGTGSISVSGVGKGTVYTIYKMLNLTSAKQDGDTTLYTYTVTTEWESFFRSDAVKPYFDVNNVGYVTWKLDVNDSASAAAFAKLALAHAESNPSIQETKTITSASDNATLLFSDLELGYYLIDSDMGSLCGLTTTNPNAAIQAKNKAPTLQKQVKEDSTHEYVDSNTADIGQDVEFLVIIDVHAGAQDYILHDMMEEGLKFKSVDKIEHVTPGATDADTVTEPFVNGTDFTVKTTGMKNADCDFEIVFTETACNRLKNNDKLKIYYTAMLTRYATTTPTNGNTNTAHLEFGAGHTSNPAQATTYTFEFDIVKTDSNNKFLNDAHFRIYDAATGGNEVKVVPLMEANDTTPVLDKNKNQIYRRARPDETVGVPIIVNGITTVRGLDNGTYYLEEVEEPDGYNKLDRRVEFTISGENLKATFTKNPTTGEDMYVTNSGVHVVNQAGNKLPETGAMGTSMFILFGTFVMLGTGVLLVTKKRMSMIED